MSCCVGSPSNLVSKVIGKDYFLSVSFKMLIDTLLVVDSVS